MLETSPREDKIPISNRVSLEQYGEKEPLPRQRTRGAHTLAVEPKEDWEGDTEDDSQPSQQGVTSSQAECVEHLLAEEREGKAQQ